MQRAKKSYLLLLKVFEIKKNISQISNMFAAQVRIRILTLLLSTFLSVKLIDSTCCRDFTFADCKIIDNFETVNDINETICQSYCDDIFTDKCTFFDFDYKQKLCSLFEVNFDDFAKNCLVTGGPKYPPFAQCQSNPCNVSNIY